MRGSSDIISGMHELRKAYARYENFQLEYPGGKGANLFKEINKRIYWCYTQLLTHPSLPETVREGIKAEWESDVFTVDAISEKVALLNPEQRETLEVLLDSILNGEEIEAVIK